MRAVPQVGGAGRRGQLLGMIGEDVMGRDVGQFVRREQKLVRYDIFADLRRPCEVAVSAEIAVGVAGLEFETLLILACVVEAA